MRSWHPIPPLCLDDKRLLGEHVEIHAIDSINKKGLKGYSRHPEVLRWKDYPEALVLRHIMIVEEMEIRGFNHQSPIEPIPAEPEKVKWPTTIEHIDSMRYKLSIKLNGYNQ